MDRSNDKHEAPERTLRRLGSYTTARVSCGRVERVERHARRLARDAERLGLTQPPLRDIEDLLIETARATFPESDGIIRVEWSAEPGDALELSAWPRALGDLPSAWRACISKTVHPGPEARRNTKGVSVPAYDASRAEMKERGVEEALLFDADENLVEGCRSNLLVVREDGALITPDLALGAVEGMGLALIHEARPDLRFERLSKTSLKDMKEIIAVNAVRGAVPIVELDQEIVGSGQHGSVARSLAAIFRRSAVT